MISVEMESPAPKTLGGLIFSLIVRCVFGFFLVLVPNDNFDIACVPSTDYQVGRTKNALCTLVAGAVGQELHGSSNIDLEVQKQWYPDATLTGTTTEDSINTRTELTLTSATFTATKNGSGLFSGDVAKSEIDWKVEQQSDGKWEVIRWGPKFDTSLELIVEDGEIHGIYHRPPWWAFKWDWVIEGTYDDSGNVDITIHGGWLGVRMVGTIEPA